MASKDQQVDIVTQTLEDAHQAIQDVTAAQAIRQECREMLDLFSKRGMLTADQQDWVNANLPKRTRAKKDDAVAVDAADVAA